MSFHNETHVKRTRQAKRCRWCFDWIKQGDPSVVTSGVFEGDFYRGRYHPECAAAITRYYTVNKCWGEEMPDWTMNRGGILEAGEPEDIPAAAKNVADTEWAKRFKKSCPTGYAEALSRAGEPVAVLKTHGTREAQWAVTLEDGFGMDVSATREAAEDLVAVMGWPRIK